MSALIDVQIDWQTHLARQIEVSWTERLCGKMAVIDAADDAVPAGGDVIVWRDLEGLRPVLHAYIRARMSVNPGFVLHDETTDLLVGNGCRMSNDGALDVGVHQLI